MKYAFFYDITGCTLAYILLIILGWKMHKFVRSTMTGAGLAYAKKKNAELNRQLTRTLILQVILEKKCCYLGNILARCMGSFRIFLHFE